MTVFHKTEIRTEVPGVLTLNQPAQRVPLLVDSPHSGRIYPPDFGFCLPYDDLLVAEDRFIDLLIADAAKIGATTLWAEFPRSYIDANRAPDDVDLALIPDWTEPVCTHDARSAAGIGLVRRLLKSGIPMYDRALSVAEVSARIKTYYEPYHATLKAALDDLHYQFGQVFYLTVHSMPAQVNNAGPDIVLGDLDGTACDPYFTLQVKDYFQSMGYRVKLNDPYKGAECSRRYSQPHAHRHALQLEICKSLYLNGNDINDKKFNALKDDLNAFFEWLAARLKPQTTTLAAD